MAASLDLEQPQADPKNLHLKLFFGLGLMLICLHMLHIIDLD